MDYIKIGFRSYMIILFISTLPFIEGSNINCNGKAFHCVNSTHFKICVDLGGGVSTTVDEFLIPCPQNTVCKPYNLFECEYELMTTLSPVTIQSEVTNEQFQTSDSSVSEKLDITTLFPMKQLQGLELSEKYYDKVNATPASYTRSFLTDAIISPVTASNSNGLHSDSDIDKKNNVTSSTDKELRFSTIESGINVTQTLPYNINTSVTGINHNIKSPIFFSITNDTKTLYSIKNESLEPLNKNSLDLDPTLTVTKITDQVSNLSELRYTAPVTLLPDNISESSLQENTLRISNINSLINPKNTSQKPNLDLLITYNTTQLINSDNNTEYHNTDIKTLNSTKLNVITDKIFTSDESNINNKAKVNSAITFESLGQHLAEITTASTIKVSGTTNQFIADNFLNEADATEVFLNDGLNKTKNLEKLSVTDRDIIIPTTIQPENSAVKINEMSSQITNSGLNNDVSSVTLTNPIFEIILPSNTSLFNTAGTKFAVNDKIIVGDYSYRSDNMLPIFTTAEISNGVTNSKSIPDLISKNETWPKPVMAAVVTDLNSNNKTTTEVSNNITAEIIEGGTNLKSIPDVVSKNETRSKPILVIAATDLDKNNITTTEVSSNITAEISNGVTNLKSIPDLISKNETWPKPVMAAVATDLVSNNKTSTEVSNNIIAEIIEGVTNLKSIPGFVSKNETGSKPILVTAATDLDKNNITTTEVSNNITAEISNGVTNLKSIPDLISKNETWPMPLLVTAATNFDKNKITTTEESNNITAEISNGDTSLKSIPDLIWKNETLLKPVTTAVPTDFDSNNIATTEVSNNITAEIIEGGTNLKSIPDVVSKNETRSKPILVIAATDLDKNNITTTEVSSNITAEISNGVTNLKSIPDLISKNETWPKPVMAAVATDLVSNNKTSTEVSNNIIAEIIEGVTNLKSIPGFVSKNETGSKPILVTAATDLDKNNITTTEVSNNLTTKIFNGITSLQSIPNSISKNEILLKPVVTAVATDFDSNDITTREVSNNITAAISNGDTSLKSIPDLISKNETWPKPVMAIVGTDIDSNNITTTEASNNIADTDFDKNNITTIEVSNNITAKIFNGIASLQSIPNVIWKNETLLKPVMGVVATDLDSNNKTKTELSNNITAEISNEDTSLKSTPDLIWKNETLLKPVTTAVPTDLNSNNITTTEASNNITTEIADGVTSLKSMPDFVSKNETRSKPILVTAATDFVKNNITTTEVSNNITAEISNGDISLISIPDLISKNETLLKPVMTAVATDFVSNNITTTEASNNITTEISDGVISLKSMPDVVSKNETRPKPILVTAATDFDKNNITTTEVSNNIRVEIFNGIASLQSIPNAIWKNETLLKPVIVIVAADLDSNNKTSTEVSNNITAEISNGDISLISIPYLISKNETLLKPVMTAVATDSDSNNITTTEVSNNIIAEISNRVTSLKSITNSISRNETWPKPILATVPTDFDSIHKTTTEIINNITEATHNNDSTNPTINSLYEINKALSINSTLMNITLDFYQTATKSNTVYITSNSMDVTNNTFTTAKPTTYFDADTTRKPVISLEKKNLTTMTTEPAKKEMYTKQVIYKNTSYKDQILDKYSLGNQNLTKRKTKNILISKLVTTNDFSLLPALNYNITYTNNNITDKNILKHIETKHTNNLLKKSLTVDINNTDLNFTNKNIVSSADSKSKSIPLVYLHSSFMKPPLPNINNVSHSYFSENISPTRMFDKTTASNQNNETEDREPSKTKKNGLVPVNVIGNIEHEGNKTVYLKLNPYKQVTKPAIEVWTVANTTVGATFKTFIQDRNVSKVKNVSVIKSKENNSNAFNTTSKSYITANNLLRNMSSQTNSIKNKARDAMPSNVLEFSKIPSKFYKFPLTDPLKMDTTSLVLNTTKFEIIRKQEKNTISDHSNQSNGSEKKQIRNGNGSPPFILKIGNGVTENLRNNTQNSFAAPIHNISYHAYGNPPTNQELSCTKRGKYSDTKNCHKFYVCLGRGKPIIGVCPTGTVFSEYLKQCTKNVTHCIRNNQFKCTAAGRFINILSNNSYFICAMKKSGFIRFTLHCQKGYYLDKNNIKCTPELNSISLISYENSSKITKELSFERKEIEGVTANSKNVFECEKEGKFKDSQDCRKYYVCKKGRKSMFRRKIKKCDSDEVFHRKKKKCVDVESYECDI